MKSKICLLLAALLFVTLAACGETQPPAASNPPLHPKPPPSRKNRQNPKLPPSRKNRRNPKHPPSRKNRL